MGDVPEILSPDGNASLVKEAPDFLVVALGTSAGGLAAVSTLLAQIPAQAPLAFVVVQHLDPTHDSRLPELLGRSARLPVCWIADQMPLQPAHVYVLPPNHAAAIKNGVLFLEERKSQKQPNVIDRFFRSLADDCKHRAVGVILSGNGSDGTLGLRAIKAAGGIAFVQAEGTATFPGMPHAAIASGHVDRVIELNEIAEELLKLTHDSARLWPRLAEKPEEFASEQLEHLTVIFRLLQSRTGVDFSAYKPTTIMRRLARRIVLTKAANLAEYAKLLQKSREELAALYDGMLINVTEFFRDPEHYEFIQEDVLPNLLLSHTDNQQIRVWVPGCSTGEEAYSLAIMLRETLDAAGRHVPVQIFGTDISDPAIAAARAGFYSPGEVGNVSPERLRRFFVKGEFGYTVSKTIRDMCVFARQNVVNDSPFSRIDLLSCRNVLIYFGPALQQKLMPIFHYALNATGYLALGNSESVGPHVDLFRLVDRRYPVYTRKSTHSRPRLEFSTEAAPTAKLPLLSPKTDMTDPSKEPSDVLREADRLVLARHAPSGVLVNEELEILQFRGDVSPYLSPMPGRASLNLTRMAREGLAAELAAIVLQAKQRGVRVHRPRVTLVREKETRLIDVDVTPIEGTQSKERFYLILFVEHPTAPRTSAQEPAPEGSAPPSDYADRLEQLNQDLEVTRSYLQSTVEKHEHTNQELRAANEEIQSSNEELQSTNEELETAKEELQSTNEELTTVNDELHSRQVELIQVNNDLNNLINSVHLPIIILGADLRIRRFTPMAEKVLNVIPTDIGRPLTDLNSNLNVTDLPRKISDVMESLTTREIEVQDRQGHWYSMRLRPYKTLENKIEGVVLTLIDIDTMKRTIAELEETRNFSQAVVETIREPLVVVTDQLRVKVANETFYQFCGTSREQMEGRLLFEVSNKLWDVPGLRPALEKVLLTEKNLADFPLELHTAFGGRRQLLLNARQIVSTLRSYQLILLSFTFADSKT